MAQINQEIKPTQDPSYLRNSRAVDAPSDIKPTGTAPLSILPEGVKIADRSAEYQGQADAAGMKADAIGDSSFASLFSDVVGIGNFLGKAGDSLIKKSIENQVYDVVRQTQQAQMNALEDVKTNPGLMNIIGKQSSSQEPVPSELENLPSQLSAMQGAKDSGKISNTYYYGRLLSEAKNLRAKYPGYREYIDQQFAKVSGVNPANAYIQGLIGDINRNAALAGSSRNKMDKFIQSNIGLPNSEKVKALYDSGRIGDIDVFNWAAPYHQQEAKLKRQGLIIQTQEAGDKYNIKQSQLHGSDVAATTISNWLDNIASVGTPQGLDKPANIMDLITRAENGQIPQAQIQAYGQQLVQSREQLRLDLQRKFDTPGVDGISLTRRVGGLEERNKIINSSLAQVDSFIDNISKGEFALAHSSANAIKSRIDDNTLKLMDNPKMGSYFTQLGVLRKLGGDQFTQNYFKDLIKEDIPRQYQEYVKGIQMEMMTQSRRQNTGSTFTFTDVFEDMKRKGIDDPRVTRSVLGSIKKITDNNTPEAVKAGIALSAFSPENRDMIAKINKDSYDNRGRPIKGQYGVFSDFTSPEMTRAISKLSSKEPQIGVDYKNWAESTFAQLFGQTLRDLDLNTNVGRPESFKITWDPLNKRFESSFKNSGDTSEARYVAEYQRKLNQINSGLSGLKNIAKANGYDIEDYLMQTLRTVGFNPSTSGIVGVPLTLMESIRAASEPKANFNQRFNSRGE